MPAGGGGGGPGGGGGGPAGGAGADLVAAGELRQQGAVRQERRSPGAESRPVAARQTRAPRNTALAAHRRPSALGSLAMGRWLGAQGRAGVGGWPGRSPQVPVFSVPAQLARLVFPLGAWSARWQRRVL